MDSHTPYNATARIVFPDPNRRFLASQAIASSEEPINILGGCLHGCLIHLQDAKLKRI
jgi:hypothetical protein